MRTLIANGTVSREELFISTKNGYIPNDADSGKSAAILVAELIEEGLITKEDVAAEIHCMHPAFLENQLEASLSNLGLETVDLMYMHNTFESQSHFCEESEYMDKLKRAFEFLESKRQ